MSAVPRKRGRPPKNSISSILPMTIKIEPDFDIESAVKCEDISYEDPEDVNEVYCRICFKIFTLNDSRSEMDDDFLHKFREFIQMAMKLSSGSRWICSRCSATVEKFWKFKNSVVEKQALFAQLVARGAEEYFHEIQKLADNTNTNEADDDFDSIDNRIFVKQEPFDGIFNDSDFSLVTAELTDVEPSRPRKSSPKRPKYQTVSTIVSLRKPYTRRAPQSCPKCGKLVTNITNHMIKVHNERNVYSCNACSYSTLDRKKLRLHMMNEHSQKLEHGESQVCPHCAKQVRKLDEHIANIHRGERNFFCDICPFSSYKKKPIEQHMMNLHLPKNVHCSLCDFKTISQERLRKHIKNLHEVNEEPTEFYCNVPDCGKGFKNRFNLQCHVKRCHEGEVNFPCTYPGCRKSFFSRSEMRIHYENSHGPKNVICDTCGACFSSVAMLRKHSSLHREYKYKCTFPNCTQKYRNSTQLKYHINRIHLTKKDYQCDRCPSAFYTPRDLERHISAKHLGIRFVCELPGCKSALSRRDAYLNHLKQHSELTEEDRKILVEKCNDFCYKHNLKK